MSNDAFEYSDKGLNNLLKALSDDRAPKARVGVLGSKDGRKQGNSNATIGLKHEMGVDGAEIRSFLRMPITDELQRFLDNSGLFTKELLQQVIEAGSVEAWVSKIGIVAEAVVAEGFATGGFGKWKPSNMKYKTVHQTLIETQQLRNSITSDTK